MQFPDDEYARRKRVYDIADEGDNEDVPQEPPAEGAPWDDMGSPANGGVEPFQQSSAYPREDISFKAWGVPERPDAPTASYRHELLQKAMGGDNTAWAQYINAAGTNQALAEQKQQGAWDQQNAHLIPQIARLNQQQNSNEARFNQQQAALTAKGERSAAYLKTRGAQDEQTRAQKEQDDFRKQIAAVGKGESGHTPQQYTQIKKAYNEMNAFRSEMSTHPEYKPKYMESMDHLRDLLATPDGQPGHTPEWSEPFQDENGTRYQKNAKTGEYKMIHEAKPDQTGKKDEHDEHKYFNQRYSQWMSGEHSMPVGLNNEGQMAYEKRPLTPEEAEERAHKDVEVSRRAHGKYGSKQLGSEFNQAEGPDGETPPQSVQPPEHYSPEAKAIGALSPYEQQIVGQLKKMVPPQLLKQEVVKAITLARQK